MSIPNLDELIDALLPGFAEESEELCEQITKDLLDLESTQSPEAAEPFLTRIARGLHTLKGTSATVGLEELSTLAHHMEDLLDAARQLMRAKQSGLMHPTAIDTFLLCLDAFLERAQARAAGEKEPLDIGELLAALSEAEAELKPAAEGREAEDREAAHRSADERSTDERAVAHRSADGRAADGRAEKEGRGSEKAKEERTDTELSKADGSQSEPAEAEPAQAGRSAQPEEQSAELDGPGGAKTEAEHTREGIGQDASWRIRSGDLMALVKELERLRELRLRLELRSREISTLLPLLKDQLTQAAHSAKQKDWHPENPSFEELTAGQSNVEANVEAIGGTASTLPGNTVRKAGQNQSSLINSTLEDRLAALRRGLINDADEARDIVDGAESVLKAVATVPMRTLAEPLRRAAREVSRMRGREVQLSLVGGELGIERHVLEHLRGPLVHLVRNAVDHGIEEPSLRQKAGKHREGTVVVRAEQQGNLLFVSVEDDGQGLASDKIRSRAQNLNLYRESMQDNQPALHKLIFTPGFSTARDLSSASGRGVGLDVVRDQVEALDGNVEVESRPGQGCRFVIVLPVDLGSSPLLLVRCGEYRLGIPVLSVSSIHRSRPDSVTSTRTGISRIQIEGEAFPLRRLGALLGLEPERKPNQEQPILLLHSQGNRVAIAVDEILGDRDLMIRALPDELRQVEAYQGAGMLADGELLLVLRPDWLVRKTRSASDSSLSGADSASRALVVDDSLTARAMHRTMLESGGFVVHTARGGREALERLAAAPYDVVVCDIGMDDMDGYALTQHIRKRSELEDLPIILVSAHDSAANQRQGFEVGADAFLSKRECESGRLVTEALGVMARRRAQQ